VKGRLKSVVGLVSLKHMISVEFGNEIFMV